MEIETRTVAPAAPSRSKTRAILAYSTVALSIAGVLSYAALRSMAPATAEALPAAGPTVEVSAPLVRSLSPQRGFLGQFAAVNKVELRAQVGGTLSEIRFKDGDIVRKGDLLFVIDPVPYDIKMSQANAQLEAANARLALATRELSRAQTLKRDDAGSEQNVDQRAAQQREAQAAVEAAKASVRDARFDLDRTRISAPFTGRIGTHLVSVGNLVSGSRAGAGPTTLLATLVSLDPMYVNFDLSEADYMAFMRERGGKPGAVNGKVQISLSDEKNFDREGVLNFVDNSLNRASGTIHARATVSNSDLLLTPGGFARIRLAMSTDVPTLLVPDAAVIADQTDRLVMTVDATDKIAPKKVEIGELRDGLRVIRSGLEQSDRVVVGGLLSATPGAKVVARAGTIKFASGQE